MLVSRFDALSCAVWYLVQLAGDVIVQLYNLSACPRFWQVVVCMRFLSWFYGPHYADS